MRFEIIKLYIWSPFHQVKEVDIFKEEDLVEHFKNTDAVVSCLGCRPSFLGWSTITFYLDTIKPIVAAMRTANKKRLVCMSAWGTVCKYTLFSTRIHFFWVIG